MSFNTGNELGSLDERDLYDNAINLDQAMNSTDPTWTDRFGVEKPTIDAVLKSAGFMPAGFDFVTGGALQPGDRNKAVYNPAPNGDNNWYRWNGTFPKVITSSSQPEPKNDTGWVPVDSDKIIREDLLESVLTLREGIFALRDFVSIKDFGAKGDGVTDDTIPFKLAIAHVNSGVVFIPEGIYKIAFVNLKSEQFLLCQNAVIRPLTNTSTCLIATNINNAGIIGNVTFLGSREDLSDKVSTGERGLEINGGENLRLENLTFKRFKGVAYFRGDRPSIYYGNHLQGSSISFVENIIGASIYSQYDTYTNMSAVGNETGVENWGGNLNWSCGNVTDNQIGFAIRDSANNGHGIITGVQFNHNKYFAIDVDKTLLGFTFADCHVYGFEDGVGRIRVKDSRGVDFTGGTYDCWFEMSEQLGILEDCYLRDVYAPGGYGPLKIYNPKTNKRSRSLRVSGVTGPGYINAIDSLNVNDLALVAYAVSRKGNDLQMLNNGDYLVMTTVDEVGDVRGNLESSGTSIYEYPAVVRGHYNIQLDLVIAGTGITECYIETVCDGKTVAYAYGMDIGEVGGRKGYKFNASQNVIAGNNIRFIVRTNGTGVVHAPAPFDSKMVIRLVNQ